MNSRVISVKKGVLPKQNSHEALSFDSKNLFGL